MSTGVNDVLVSLGLERYIKEFEENELDDQTVRDFISGGNITIALKDIIRSAKWRTMFIAQFRECYCNHSTPTSTLTLTPTSTSTIKDTPSILKVMLGYGTPAAQNVYYFLNALIESLETTDDILTHLAKVRYGKEMKVLINQNSCKDLLKLHEKAVSIALEFVSEMSGKMSSIQKQRVKRVLDEMKPKPNDNKMFSVLINAAKLQYKKAMDAFTLKADYIDDTKLLKDHEKATDSAIELVSETKPLSQEQKQSIRLALENMFQSYQEVNSKKKSSSCPAIGIDLGTTNCCLAVFRNPNKPEIIPSAMSRDKTPSYVAFPSGEEDDDDEPVFGEVAKTEAFNNPQGTIFDMKRMLGRQLNDPRLQRDMKFWPFEVIEEEGIFKVKTPLASYTPVEITAELLKHLMELADNFLNAKVISAVVAVPAYFNNIQRELTKKACKLAGLNVLQLVSEPTAAAVAYSMHKKQQGQITKNCIIFDFGGGTLDIAILSISSNKIQVKAVGGDAHLGGQDIDNNMMEYCLKEFQNEHGIDLKVNIGKLFCKEDKLKMSNRLRRLKTECEKQKCFLSQENVKEVTVSLDAMHGGIPLIVKMSRSTFEALNKSIFEKCIEAMKQVLEDSNMDKRDIDEVVMVGGSSRIPLVQNMVSEFFGGKQPCRSIDMDQAVAEGAAMLAFQAESVEIPNIFVQESEERERKILSKVQQLTTSITIHCKNTLTDNKQNIQSVEKEEEKEEKLVLTAVESYNYALDKYIKSMDTELYIDPKMLKSQHALIKTKVFEEIAQNGIISQSKEMFQNLDIEFDSIFDEAYNESLDSEEHFKTILQEAEALIDSKFNENIAILREKIRKDPFDFHIDIDNQILDFYKHRMHFTNDLPEKWRLYFSTWFSNEAREYFSDLNKVQRQKNSYFEHMKIYSEKGICIEADQLDKRHKEYKAKLNSDDKSNYTSGKHEKLRELAQYSIELIYEKIVQTNSKAIEAEEQAVKKALEFAQNTYNDFMKSKIEAGTYTNKEIKELHEIGVKSFLENFECLPNSNYSYIWLRHTDTEKINNFLQPMLKHYVKMNEDKLQAKLLNETRNEKLRNFEKRYAKSTTLNQPMSSTEFTSEFKNLYHHTIDKYTTVESLRDFKSKSDNPSRNIRPKLDLLRLSSSLKIEKEKEIENDNKVEYRPGNIVIKDAKRITKITRKEPYGVGIYFSPDIVRIEIDKKGDDQSSTLQWHPTLCFTGEAIEFFPARQPFGNCYNVYNLLEENQYEPKTVRIYSNCMKLFSDEIVGIFLNKIKSEAENRFQLEIKSCVVATSAFMSTSGKHKLKSAMFIAGFKICRFIQCTTAIGLSCIIQNREIQNQSLAIVNNGSSTFDIAFAEINQKSISIHKIKGTPHLGIAQGNKSEYSEYSESDLNVYKFKLLESKLRSITKKKPHTIILIASIRNEELINDIRKIKFPKSVEKVFYDERQIARGAAALDFSLNYSVGKSSLQCTEAFPYSLIAQWGNESHKLVAQNTPIIEKHLSSSLKLRETRSQSQNLIQVSIFEKENSSLIVYNVPSSYMIVCNAYLYINLNLEGLLESVERKSIDGSTKIQLQASQTFMNREQQLEAVEKLRFILIPSASFTSSI